MIDTTIYTSKMSAKLIYFPSSMDFKNKDLLFRRAKYNIFAQSIRYGHLNVFLAQVVHFTIINL